MQSKTAPMTSRPGVIVVGAGIGGLAAALRLVSAGLDVTVLERHAWAGGKMRAVSTPAGPADAGPTVLTLRHVFDDLFAAAGARLDDHVKLCRQETLARHFWPDGVTLDLWRDQDRSKQAIQEFAGREEAQAFEQFCDDTRRLFEAFDLPLMQAAAPSPGRLTMSVLRQPGLVPRIAPLSTLHRSLKQRFRDPRLVQLFGRYATYVGGSPYLSPAVLALIWQAEAQGVWTVTGGMHRLAQAIATLAQAKGARFRFGAHVDRIEVERGRVVGVRLRDGVGIAAGSVVFNGDPRALALGRLGGSVSAVGRRTASAERSLSARVWSFAARFRGPDLAHHNVFFTTDAHSEFDALRAGRFPSAQTLYLCAQDRIAGAAPQGTERFEIIANAAPLTAGQPPLREFETCQGQTFRMMARFGARFDRLPTATELSTPTTFENLFPGSAGALYGQSPHSAMTVFRRPRATTVIAGLYLAGGAVHPGPGVPMAALSGRHAAEAIMRDLASTSPFHPADTHGGTLTGSAGITAAPFPSSPS